MVGDVPCFRSLDGQVSPRTWTCRYKALVSIVGYQGRLGHLLMRLYDTLPTMRGTTYYSTREHKPNCTPLSFLAFLFYIQRSFYFKVFFLPLLFLSSFHSFFPSFKVKVKTIHRNPFIIFENGIMEPIMSIMFISREHQSKA